MVPAPLFCSGFYKFNQELRGGQLGKDTVELIQELGGIDRMARFRGPQSAARHPDLIP